MTVFSMFCPVMTFKAHAQCVWADPELAARALLPCGRTKEYRGHFEAIGRKSGHMTGSFVLNKDLEVTSLKIDSIDVPIPEGRSLPGLPIKDRLPLTRLAVTLAAIDYSGQEKSIGILNASLLSREPVVGVTLVPVALLSYKEALPNLMRKGEFSYRGLHYGTGKLRYQGVVRAVPVDASPKNCVPIQVRNMANVGEAYFPYDDAAGTSGFMTYFTNQTYDSSVIIERRSVPAKVYVADLEGMHGLMIMTSDPQAIVSVRELTDDGRMKEIKLDVMEVTADYKIVYVNYGYSGPALNKVVITLTSPYPPASFYFVFQGFPTDPT